MTAPGGDGAGDVDGGVVETNKERTGVGGGPSRRSAE
jgi:hypothetical protein